MASRQEPEPEPEPTPMPATLGAALTTAGLRSLNLPADGTPAEQENDQRAWTANRRMTIGGPLKSDSVNIHIASWNVGNTLPEPDFDPWVPLGGPRSEADVSPHRQPSAACGVDTINTPARDGSSLSECLCFQIIVVATQECTYKLKPKKHKPKRINASTPAMHKFQGAIGLR